MSFSNLIQTILIDVFYDCFPNLSFHGVDYAFVLKMRRKSLKDNSLRYCLPDILTYEEVNFLQEHQVISQRVYNQLRENLKKRISKFKSYEDLYQFCLKNKGWWKNI